MISVLSKDDLYAQHHTVNVYVCEPLEKAHVEVFVNKHNVRKGPPRLGLIYVKRSLSRIHGALFVRQ